VTARGLCTKPEDESGRTPSEQSANRAFLRVDGEIALDQQQLQLRSWQASDMPWTCSAMPELMSGGTMVPTSELLLRMDEAIWSGTKPTPSRLHDSREWPGRVFRGFEKRAKR